MFFVQLLHIEKHTVKLKNFNPTDFRKQIFEEFKTFSIENRSKLHFCCVCGKNELNNDSLILFVCPHAYHKICLNVNFQNCPQCEILNCF